MASRFSASGALLVALAFVSAQATAQIIQPPPVGEPGTIVQPPVAPQVMPLAGYPPTTAPTATATYFVAPSWSQTLPANQRFVVLANFANQAILDRETGQVWTRRPITFNASARMPWGIARSYCSSLMLVRGGFRLPSKAELLSLLQDLTPGVNDPLTMPEGHPFMLNAPPDSSAYWANDVDRDTTSSGATVTAINLPSGGGISISGPIPIDDYVQVGALCVRGPN